MIDESTDVAVMKQLVLVIRYLTDTGASTSFVHIGDIIDGTAATIHTSIVKHLDDKGIPLHSLCAFDSDGAAVMTGKEVWCWGSFESQLSSSYPSTLRKPPVLPISTGVHTFKGCCRLSPQSALCKTSMHF